MVDAKVEATPHPVRGAVQLKPVVARAFSAAIAKQEIVPVVIDATPKRAPSAIARRALTVEAKGGLAPKHKHVRRTKQLYLLFNVGDGGDPNGPLVRVVRTAMAAARRHGAAWVLEHLAKADNAVQRDSAQGVTEEEGDWRAREAEGWKRLQAEFFRLHRSVTAPELANLTNSRAANRSARAHDWVKAGKVFSVNDGTVERFPVFQLREGAPSPVIGKVLGVLRGQLTPWQIAVWLTTPNAEFAEWQAPLDRLDAEPDAVVAAARREVEGAVF